MGSNQNTETDILCCRSFNDHLKESFCTFSCICHLVGILRLQARGLKKDWCNIPYKAL